MNIGMVSHGRFPPDPRIEKEGRILIKEGYNLFVYANAEVTSHPVKLFKGVKVRYFRLRYSPLFLLYYLPKKLKSWFLKDRIDIVHIQDTPIALPAFRAARSVGKPIVFDIHEIWPQMIAEEPMLRMMNKIALIFWCKISEYLGCKVARAIICTSQEMALYLMRHYSIPESKMSVVMNVSWIPDIKYFTRLSVNIDAFKVCYLGNMNSKNLLLGSIIESATFLKGVLNFYFYFVGDGNLRPELEKYAQKRGVGDRIIFTGLLSQEQAHSYVLESDVCLLPYKKTFNTNVGTAHKMFEYLSYGKAVISTPLAPYIRMLKDAVYFWEPSTPKRLSEIIYELSCNKRKREELGKKSRKLVETKYNWEVESQKLLEVYEKIRKRKR